MGRSFLLFFVIFFSLCASAKSSDPVRLSKEWISSKFASDGDEFRQIRRVGVGTAIGGVHGIMGFNLDLNFTHSTSFGLGYGFGEPFNSFSLYLKRHMGSQMFSPYFSAGFARWTQYSDSHGPISSSTPSFLAERFLTTNELKTGKFQKNFIYPALGLQYTQFSGDWTGLALALELDLLVDVEKMISASTGTLNCTYYF